MSRTSKVRICAVFASPPERQTCRFTLQVKVTGKRRRGRNHLFRQLFQYLPTCDRSRRVCPLPPLCSVVPNAWHDGQSASGSQDWRNPGCPQARAWSVLLAPANWLAVSCDTNLQTLAVHSKQAAELTAELGIAPTGCAAQIRVPFPSE